MQAYKHFRAFNAVTYFSLLWLFLGNIVGLTLAVLLLEPRLGQFISPFTYGRLLPLHINFQLYGWHSIPLIGLLFYWFLDVVTLNSKKPFFPLIVWSISLTIGGFSWLFGMVSGKIFLEWTGISASLFICNLIFLWLFLVVSTFRKITRKKFVILLGFVLVPIAFHFALSPKTFPPINSSSSGATGASLMVSTLGIIFIFLLTPIILNVSMEDKDKKIISRSFFILILHTLFWALIPHSHSSHHDVIQIIGLGSLIIWIPLLQRYFSYFLWTKASLIWLQSFIIWTLVLFPSAWVMFLPGVLEVTKFSNFIVAHVHVAMAGMLSSFSMLVLLNLPICKTITRALANKNFFWCWTLGLVVHISALLIIFWREAIHFGITLNTDTIVLSSLGLRVIGGLLMCLSSLFWLKKCNFN